MKIKESFNLKNIDFDKEQLSKEVVVGFEYKSADGNSYSGTLIIKTTPVEGMVIEKYDTYWVEDPPPEYTKKDDKKIYEAYRSGF